MTPTQLIAARDGAGNAAQAATDLWAEIVPGLAPGRRAGAALDLIAKHIGASTDVPDNVLREAVVRLAAFLKNTGAAGGLVELQTGTATMKWQSEFHGSALRRSGVMSLLLPWTVKRAGAI